jgi:hypothetical protein
VIAEPENVLSDPVVVSRVFSLVIADPLAVFNDPVVISNADKRLLWVAFVKSLLAVYVRILELNACKALIFVLLLPVYVFNDVSWEAKEALYVDDPVIFEISVPLSVNEPVTNALCNTICYDCFI